MRTSFLLLLCAFWTIGLCAQINYTANDTIPGYSGDFLYGANMGYFPQWDDEQLADIAAGNATYNLPGVGVKSLRPLLPEDFLDEYGYEYRLETFFHYDTIGIKENTVMIGYPSDAHLDPNFYCTDSQSRLFDNMYEDIWDDGSDGTPYNDDNYYAAYLFKLVSLYKDYIKFYEVWNEPDFDYGVWGWRQSGQDGNWWDNDPDPCNFALRSPVQHYVRLLRISYEVIKSVDSTAYVAVGGLGYESFLDAVMRNTDNPNGGTPTADYPLYGGAYFDVMSFHSYPHIDGSLREWNNDTGEFDYFRHSDAAVDGVLAKKAAFETVLHNYDYDGSVYPEKIFIITECNVPRKQFSNYLGSNEAQKNFLIKTLVTVQKNAIRQFYVFNLAERAPYEDAASSTKLMGLFSDLNTVEPYQQETLDAGIAYKTTSDLLFGMQYDSMQTKLLELHAGLDGGAFLDPTTGFHTYVVWAKTHLDMEESVADTFSFPQTLGILELERKYWNHSKEPIQDTIDFQSIPLTSTPIFLRDFTNNALPVELLSFSAVQQDEAVHLKWITLSETNNDRFEIEHAIDGNRFVRIGTTIGALNSSIKNEYTFQHAQAIAGNNYYRIKQIDLDGHFEYSPVRVVDFLSSNTVSLKPTLSASKVTVELSNTAKEIIRIEVYDIMGQQLLDELIPVGLKSLTLNMAGFPLGHYFVKCNLSSGHITKRFLKIAE